MAAPTASTPSGEGSLPDPFTPTDTMVEGIAASIASSPLRVELSVTRIVHARLAAYAVALADMVARGSDHPVDVEFTASLVRQIRAVKAALTLLTQDAGAALGEEAGDPTAAGGV